MQRLTLNDLQKAMKLLSVRMSDERLGVVAPLVNLNIDTLQVLTKDKLTKELEPTTFVAELKKLGRVKGSAPF
jgi:hypothetical protein